MVINKQLNSLQRITIGRIGPITFEPNQFVVQLQEILM